MINKSLEFKSENNSKIVILDYPIIKWLFIIAFIFIPFAFLIYDYSNLPYSPLFIFSGLLIQSIFIFLLFFPLQTKIIRNLGDNSLYVKKVGPFYIKKELNLNNSQKPFLRAEGLATFFPYLIFYDNNIEQKLCLTSSLLWVMSWGRGNPSSFRGKLKKNNIEEISKFLNLGVTFEKNYMKV